MEYTIAKQTEAKSRKFYSIRELSNNTKNDIYLKKKDFMRKEYDIKNLDPRKNPYTKAIKKQVTINLDESVIEYFKKQSESSGIPYQTLINLYLRDCLINDRHIEIAWK